MAAGCYFVRMNGSGAERNYNVAFIGIALAVLVMRLERQNDLAGLLVGVLGACALLWAALAPGALTRERGLLLGVLFGSILGDAALNWTPWPALCIVPFAGVHLCLLYLCVRLCPRHPWPKSILLVTLLCGVVFFVWHFPAMPSIGAALVAALYLLLLALMMWCALALLVPPRPAAARWLVPGALCYSVTDHVVIYYQMHPSPPALAFIWIFYPMALYLLSRASVALVKCSDE